MLMIIKTGRATTETMNVATTAAAGWTIAVKIAIIIVVVATIKRIAVTKMPMNKTPEKIRADRATRATITSVNSRKRNGSRYRKKKLKK